MLRKALLSSTLSLALVAGGSAAQAAAPVRAAAPISASSEMDHGDSTIWIIGGVLVAILVIVLIAHDHDHNDLPHSP